MKSRIVKPLLLIFVLIFAQSCSKSVGTLSTVAGGGAANQNSSAKAGVWDKGSYSNELTNIKISLPDGWLRDENAKSSNPACVFDFMLYFANELSTVMVSYESTTSKEAEYLETFKEQLLSDSSLHAQFNGESVMPIANKNFTKAAFTLYDGEAMQDVYLYSMGDYLMLISCVYPQGGAGDMDTLLSAFMPIK